MKRTKISFKSAPVQIVVVKHEVEIIGVWTNNFQVVLKALSKKNTEICIKRQGSKLVLRYDAIKFYRCIPYGGNIEIPINEVIYEDEFPPPHKDDEETVTRMKSWGLLK